MHDWAVGNHKLHIFMALHFSGVKRYVSCINCSSSNTLKVLQSGHCKRVSALKSKWLHYLIKMLSLNKKIGCCFAFSSDQLKIQQIKLHNFVKMQPIIEKNYFNLQFLDPFNLLAQRFHCVQSSDLFEVNTFDNFNLYISVNVDGQAQL